MFITRKAYEAMLRRNDDRDFAALRSEVERLRSDVRGLRTWLQRNIDTLSAPNEDEVADEGPIVAASVPGGWGR